MYIHTHIVDEILKVLEARCVVCVCIYIRNIYMHTHTHIVDEILKVLGGFRGLVTHIVNEILKVLEARGVFQSDN
jgi:hypothetical protein